MNDYKKVSIIITTYGGEWKLQRAVSSLLEQTYPAIEIIVVDDNEPGTAARKNTERIMQQYVNDTRIKYIKHKKNMNGAAARNTGIRAVSGKYVAFLDDDDYYLKDRIQISVDQLESNEAMDGICTSVIKMKSGRIVEIHQLDDHSELKWNTLFINQNILGTGSNIFIRKEVVDKIGFFDETFERFQDLEYMIRVCSQYHIGTISDKLIVKDIAGYRAPSYQKIKKSFSYFCERFHDAVIKLEEKDRQAFYEDRYRYLFELAVLSGKKQDIKESAEQLMSVRKLTGGEKLKCSLWFITSPVINLKKNLASGDGLLVRMYRKLKNPEVVSIDNDQLKEEYYYRFQSEADY